MRGKKTTLAVAITALAILLASPWASAKEKKQGLLESARQTIEDLANGTAVAEKLGSSLGGGTEPRTVPTLDGQTMPNPRTMNLLIGQAVDLRDLEDETIQTWEDRYSGIIYQVVHIRRNRLNERVTSDFHVAFRQEGAWNTIGQMTSREADVVVRDYTQDGRVDQRTIEGLKKAHKMGPQTLVIPEITYLAVERAIEGNFDRRMNFEWIQAIIKINVFLIDLETGITRQAFEVEGHDQGFLASGIWTLFLKNAGLTYVQQLTNKASAQAARKAAKLMAAADNGPVRWIDRDPLERIKGEVLNGTPFKAVGKGVVGDLVEVGERTWTLRFADAKGIKPQSVFEIWSATKLGLPDAPTGVKVVVDFIAGQGLVGAHVSAIDPRTSGVLPAPAPSGAEVAPRPEPTEPVRPSNAGPVEPGVSFEEEFARALPGDVLPLAEGEEPEGFSAFVALTPEFMPAKGEKKATLLKRGKVVMIANPASTKDRPVKGLVGDSGYQGNPEAWVVWVIGSTDAANKVSQHVAWDGWRLYPYDPSENKGR